MKQFAWSLDIFFGQFCNEQTIFFLILTGLCCDKVVQGSRIVWILFLKGARIITTYHLLGSSLIFASGIVILVLFRVIVLECSVQILFASVPWCLFLFQIILFSIFYANL